MSPTNSIVEKCSDLRGSLEAIKTELHGFITGLKHSETSGSPEDRPEQIANAMLAFRHLEDAKMRIGKVVQATVGKSIYDTPAK